MPAFNSFGGFGYGFDMLATPIKVSEPINGTGKRDEHGQPIVNRPDPVELTEPIVNNNNPNLTFENVGGGSIEVGTLAWISRRSDWPKDTLVSTNGKEYHTVGAGQSLNANQTLYQLKEVGGNQR